MCGAKPTQFLPCCLLPGGTGLGALCGLVDSVGVPRQNISNVPGDKDLSQCGDDTPDCFSDICSHLAALSNGHVLNRLTLWIRLYSRVFDLCDNIHTLDDFTEHDMLAVQVRGTIFGCNYEELAPIGMRATVLGLSQLRYRYIEQSMRNKRSYSARTGKTHSHGQETRLVMLEVEVLVCKLVYTVYSPRARAIAIDEVAALDHEAFNLAMSVSSCSIIAMVYKFFIFFSSFHKKINAHSPRDGTCSPCSPAAGLVGSLSRQCRIDGSSRQSWGRRP